jgi:hypothetical protein
MSKMIVPEPFDEKEVDKIVYKAFQELIEIAEVNYAISFSNWEPKNKPDFFTTGIKFVGTRAEVEYSTESAPFVLVDGGTKAHDQVAKNAPFMKFPARNIPKTRPGQLASFASFESKEMVSAKKVRNPGIKARNFTEEVGKILDEQVEPVFDKHHKESSL